MKPISSLLLTLIVLLSGLSLAAAQTGQTARSNKIYLYYGYPELILSNDIAFVDGNNNSTLEIGEEGTFTFLLENKAQYVASGVIVRPRVVSNIAGLEFPSEVSLGDIPASGFKEVKISVRGGNNLTTGSASLTFYIDESGKVARTISYALDTRGR
jgi:hypothetical protein